MCIAHAVTSVYKAASIASLSARCREAPLRAGTLAGKGWRGVRSAAVFPPANAQSRRHAAKTARTVGLYERTSSCLAELLRKVRCIFRGAL